MKNNQLTTVFLGLFLLGTAANAWVSIKYNSNFRQAQRAQSSLMVINLVQSLYNESNEYAKTHPDLARLLQAPAANTRPAAPARTNR